MTGSWTTTHTIGGPQVGTVAEAEDLPACATCRRRKLRCTREIPSCSQCVRLEVPCHYEEKQKPGIKNGAVAALGRRLELLESVLLGSDGVPLVRFTEHGELIPQATEGSKIPSPSNVRKHDQTIRDVQSESRSSREAITISPEAGDEQSNGQNDISTHRGRKRKHQDLEFLDLGDDPLDVNEMVSFLPEAEIVRLLIDFFCSSFHHWIPFLHKGKLREESQQVSYPSNLLIVLHAIIAVSIRHIPVDRLPLYVDKDNLKRQADVSMRIAVKMALEDVRVECVQALAIIVFEHLNNGRPERAWPLIGSLTRMIDCLQLNTEPDIRESQPVMPPLRLIDALQNWTMLEERRRLFWVVFLFDRVISIHTGWNTSFTSEDVRRRLPADGGYFTREESVTTPYFGLWTKSAAKIGLSLANLPSQYKDDSITTDSNFAVDVDTPGSSSMIDASNLGAFARYIEATESLSQVTTFFLQQSVDWQARKDAVHWLVRFKELDLRLVHWKLFLPARWKDSNISQDKSVIDMDPNLTLAHVTHNTSMILLHHPVAYPSKECSALVALPSACSTETCISAAIETSRITDEYLRYTKIAFASFQLAFCAFVAAKAILYTHQMTRERLLSEFDHLVRSLWNMSARWNQKGFAPTNSPNSLDQAGRYARHLVYLRGRCRSDPSYRFDFFDHSCKEQSNASTDLQHISRPSDGNITTNVERTPIQYTHSNFTNTSSRRTRTHPWPNPEVMTGGQHFSAPGDFSATSQPHFSPASQYRETSQIIPNSFPQRQPDLAAQCFGQVDVGSNALTPQISSPLESDMLLTLSNTFMNPQYMEMDRIITYEDANFYVPEDSFQGG